MNELQIIDMNNTEVNINDETFRILDLNGLNWAFRKLSAIQAKENDIKSLVKAERDRIKGWEDKQLADINVSKGYFEQLVQNYHFHSLLEDPKAKTLSTPYGKSKSRASKATPEKADDAALLVHILSNDMREFVNEEVKWGDFKKSLSVADVDGVPTAFDENGQAVPGVVIKPESINFSVEVD